MTTTTALGTTPDVTVDPLRRLAAWVAPLGPLALAGWSMSIPYDLPDEASVWIPKMADTARVDLAFWMLLVATLTIGVGVIVTGLVARAGAPRLGTVGLVLGYVGFAAMGFGSMTYDVLAAAPLRAGLDVATIEQVLTAADEFSAPAIAGMAFAPLAFLGTVTLGIALWRGSVVPRWSAALLVLAFPVVFAGAALFMPLNAVGFLMVAVGFGVAGRTFATAGTDRTPPTR